MKDTRLRKMGRIPNEGMDAMQNMLAALAPLIIGIRRQAAPPLRFGTQRLHRMHVLVMGAQPPVETSTPSDDLEQVLPQLHRWPAEAKARPILGEILRGEQGEWFERLGNRIRPLKQLASGPNGEVLEVPDNYAAESDASRTSEDDESEGPAREVRTPRAEQQEATSPKPAASAFRRLIAEPGTWRVLPFGQFKPLLASQLAHPERLRDSHRIPCHLEIFEAITSQRVEVMARAILGDAAGPTDLQPLTSALIAQLELAQLVPAAPRIPAYVPEQGLVRPGQRFFHLTVASDPTAAPTTESASENVSELERATEATTAQSSAPAPTRSTTIPVQLLQPWEFCRTREEAIARLLECNSWWARSTRGFRRFFSRNSFRRWQLLLSGRNADEQLWCVPPPAEWLGDAWLQEWAGHTLELAGYDAKAMLPEWEIFWARKVRS